MRHDSNNGEPRSFVSESDVLTDGILAGKVLARENLVYDGDLLGGFTIAVGEVAALLKGDSQRCEISRRNHANGLQRAEAGHAVPGDAAASRAMFSASASCGFTRPNFINSANGAPICVRNRCIA